MATASLPCSAEFDPKLVYFRYTTPQEEEAWSVASEVSRKSFAGVSIFWLQKVLIYTFFCSPETRVEETIQGIAYQEAATVSQAYFALHKTLHQVKNF